MKNYKRLIHNRGFKREASSANSQITLKQGKNQPISSLNVSGNSRRTITIDGVEYIVPDGYTLLDYIQSDTTNNGIDTGILGTDVTRFKVYGYCSPNGISNTQLIGGAGTSTLLSVIYGSRVSGGVAYWYAMDSNGNSLVSSSNWAISDITINSTTSQTGTIIDKTTGISYDVAKLSASSWQLSNGNVYLFGGNTTASRRSPDAKCRYLKLWTASGVAFVGVAMKNSSNVVGMYDFVTNTFITPTTGTFTAGSELPMPNGGEVTGNLYDGTTNYFPITSDMVGKSISWKLFDSTNFVRSAIAPTESGVETYIGTTAGDTRTITAYDATNGHLWIEKSGKVAFSASELVSQKFMVVEGSTIPTTYEPYGTKSQPLGVIGVGDKTENLFDKSAITLNSYVRSDGTVVGTSTAGLTATNYMEVFEGESYTLVGTTTQNTNTLAFNWFDSNKTILATRPTKVISNNTNVVWTETAPTSACYLRCNIQTSATQGGDTWMVVKGSTAPISYIPYGYAVPILKADNPQMTSAETHTAYLNSPLLKVGNYSDEVDVIKGKVIRRVGVKVLDGTENWNWTSVRNELTISDALVNTSEINYTILCSDFVGYSGITGITSMPDNSCKINNSTKTLLLKDTTHSTDSATWTSWLASQYASGTPVTIYYPLATPKEETITSISLYTKPNNNYIEAQTSVPVSTITTTYNSSKGLCKYDVCMVLKDNTSGKIIYVPVDDYNSTVYNSTKYTLKPFVRYTKTDGKNMLIYKNDVAFGEWAEFNRYKLECDTTTSGGFTWKVSPRGEERTSTVSWVAGDTLDSIVTQMNTGALTDYLVFSHNSGENFIRIRVGGNTYSIFTLSNITGTVTLTDLSKQMKIGDVLQDTTTHRNWQTEDVCTWFPEFRAISSSNQYARNGYNKKGYCGANFSLFKTYWSTNGSSTYVTENGTGIMNESGFDSLSSSSIEEELALYNKYSGDYDSYLKGQMIQIDDTHTDGMEYKNRSNGKEFTDLLASVTTLDFDGTWIHAFPLAYQCSIITDTDLGSCGMMTNHDIAVVMEDTNFAKINQAITILGGTVLNTNGLYGSIAQYSITSVWSYVGRYGTYGLLGFGRKVASSSARPILATTI